MGFRFSVEPGQVLIFARSVGDLDPVYVEQLSGIGGGATGRPAHVCPKR
jgi:hypothetical protein